MFQPALLLGAIALMSCQTPPLASLAEEPRSNADFTNIELDNRPLWTSDLSAPPLSDYTLSEFNLSEHSLNDHDWMRVWEPRDEKSWGFENLELLSTSEAPFEYILRVHYPAGTASPSVSRRTNSPLGGAEFYGDLFLPAQDQLRLSYYIRFADGFNFVKGGKLPGLFGGAGASGGNIPDGSDGFSARLMWRQNGDGEVYAYLPTSEDYGTSIGRGSWRFEPGIWYKIEQEIKLNTPKLADGEIRVWVNDALVLDQRNLLFRTSESLQIDGIYFSSFFGGGNTSWATPQDTYVDFANFSVTAAETDAETNAAQYRDTWREDSKHVSPQDD